MSLYIDALTTVNGVLLCWRVIAFATHRGQRQTGTEIQACAKGHRTVTPNADNRKSAGVLGSVGLDLLYHPSGEGGYLARKMSL